MAISRVSSTTVTDKAGVAPKRTKVGSAKPRPSMETCTPPLAGARSGLS